MSLTKRISNVSCPTIRRIIAALNLCVMFPLAIASGSCSGSEEFEFHRHASIIITVDAHIAVCPSFRYYTVAPLQTSVGGSLLLRAEASSDGGPVSMVGRGTGGRIADATARE